MVKQTNSTIKLLAIILFITFSSGIAIAQNATIKGAVSDTINKKILPNTVISLLRQKDSTLYIFKRSNEQGQFEIQNVKPGNYLLFVTHPGFGDYTDKLNIDKEGIVDLGVLKMTLMSHLLQEVIVKAKISAIRINGDTTEFKSDSFKVREGANVEEMLKKLPGIQVDKDGKITAMGEQVKKVLVDGEEFFGDDPTIATRNLQASDVDKVQVFDKKSDQATFSGIDDGQKEKTINLKIKADKKNGYFGKVEAGGGLDQRWNNSLMLNKFRAKEKLSAYGIMSSTGKTGLDWDERGKFGGGSDGPEYNEDNGYFMWSGGGEDEFDRQSYYGEGLPKTWSGGLNYSNKFNEDKNNLNGSYRFAKINTTGFGNNISQIITGKNVFTTKESGNSFNSKQRHSANGTYDWTIDSSTSLKIKANGYIGKTSSQIFNTSEATSGAGLLSNQSIRTTTAEGDNSKLNSSALLRKKFAKKGRTFSLNLEQVFNQSNTDGYLNANIRNLNEFGNLITNITDQNKISDSKTSSINAKITYTEPLISSKLFAEINVGIRNTWNDAQRLTYGKDVSGKYSMLNDTFSNHYKFNVLTNSGGLSFKLNQKKLTVNIGSSLAFADFSQTDVFASKVTKRNFINLFPKAGFNYKFNQSSSVNIQYNGSTSQPSINQIQPVQDNSDPLNIKIGNADLKQAFNHNIDINLNSYKVMQQRGFFFYGSLNLTENAIVNNSTISDTSGKTINQFINANGNFNYYSGLNYFIKLKKLEANLNFGLNMNGSRFNSFVNGNKNTTVNYQPGFEVGLGKDKEKKYNFYIRFNAQYNMAQTIVKTTTKTNFWTMYPSLNITYQLPWKFEINADGEYSYRQQTEQFNVNNNVLMINGYFGRKLLKNDKAIIKFVVHDLLNQNIGYTRFVTANQVSERNFQNITRYFLLSFVWNFTKKGPTNEGTDTNIK